MVIFWDKNVQRGPVLSHLLFVDDYFLFCRAIDKEVETLQPILSTFGKSSDLAVNFAKSKIFFSKNTQYSTTNNISSFLGVSECLGTAKYLGLPFMIGRKNKVLFNYLRDIIWKKISHQSSKNFSKASKEVLVKSIAKAIPLYCMSAFLLPSSLGDEIQKMLNSFWDRLTIRKEHGRLGFRHLYGFN